MRFLFCLSFISLFPVYLVAQEKSLENTQGVIITYLPQNSKQITANLKKGDVVFSYARFPVSKEKTLFQVDQFIVKLESEWIKEGKQSDFWQQKESWIKKRTRGFLIKPVAFSNNGEPLYKVKIKRKIIEQNQWSQIEFNLISNQFSLMFQEKMQKSKKGNELLNQGYNAYDRFALEKALPHFKEALSLFEEIGSNSNISKSLKALGELYRKQGKFDLALEHLERRFRLEKQLNNLVEISKALNQIGVTYQMQGKLDLALEQFKQALKFSEQAKDQNAKGLSLINIGVIYGNQGKLKLSLEYCKRALKIYQALNNLRLMANCLSDMGVNYQELGELDLALEYLHKALKLYKGFGKSQRLIMTLNNIGFIYEKKGKRDLAFGYYQQALAMAKEIGDPFSLANSLNNIGTHNIERGNLDLALEQFKQALILARKIGAPQQMILALNNQGVVYKEKGMLEEALNTHKYSLEISKQIKNPVNIIDSLNDIGALYKLQWKLDLALEHFKPALKLSEKIGFPEKISVSLNHVGFIYAKQGKLDLALKSYQNSFELSKKIGAPKLIIDSLNYLGSIYHIQGKLEKALAHYQRALNLANKIKSAPYIANSLTLIGGIFLEQNKAKKALESYTKALKLFEKVGSPPELAFAIKYVAQAFQAQGDSIALDYYQRSLKVFEQIGNPEYIATTLSSLGFIYQSQGNLVLALDYYQKALTHFEEIENPADMANSQYTIGMIYLYQERYEIALEYFKRALEHSEKIGDPQELAKILNNLGASYFVLGDKESGIKHKLRALEKIKYIANRAGSGREEYFKENLHEFAHTIELTHALFPEKSFETLQHCKAFGFLTQLSELSLKLEKSADQKLIQQQKALLSQISALSQQISQLLSKKIQENATKDPTLKPFILQKQKKLESLENQLQLTINKIREGNPAYANIQYPKSATIQEMQAKLKEDELFIEYFCAPKEHGFPGYSYCFVIGKEYFKVFQLGFTDDLKKLVKDFRTAIWDSQEEEETIENYYQQSLKLYQFLMQPILAKEEKHTVKRLIIAPDGLLNLIPFDALCFPQKSFSSYQELSYLLDSYEISYTMSATVYKHIYELALKSQKKKSEAVDSFSFLGFGDPRFHQLSKLTSLPGTREELTLISQFFEPDHFKIFLDKEAVEASLFLEDLSRYNILHFATHGLIDTKNPMHSSLALTPLNKMQQKQFAPLLKEKELEPVSCSDGFLQIRDIFQLYQKMNAELVVLSACETGLGKIERADGIVGLTRAFQFAGTPSVIVSLWSVSDESTTQFMLYFYRYLLEDKIEYLSEKKLKALHFTKKKLRNSAEYNAPYYWAPFILRGLS